MDADVVTIKIRRKSWTWLKNQENSALRAEGREPDHAEMIDRVISSFENSSELISRSSRVINGKSQQLQVTEGEFFQLQRLLGVLRSENDVAIKAVEMNLDCFDHYCRAKSFLSSEPARHAADQADPSAASTEEQSGLSRSNLPKRNTGTEG
jgi:hypothetical protein